MTIETHILSIDEKRTRLKQQIALESSRPAPDFMALKELKRINMKLKEEKCRSLDVLHHVAA